MRERVGFVPLGLSRNIIMKNEQRPSVCVCDQRDSAVHSAKSLFS